MGRAGNDICRKRTRDRLTHRSNPPAGLLKGPVGGFAVVKCAHESYEAQTTGQESTRRYLCPCSVHNMMRQPCPRSVLIRSAPGGVRDFDRAPLFGSFSNRLVPHPLDLRSSGANRLQPHRDWAIRHLAPANSMETCMPETFFPEEFSDSTETAPDRSAP